MLYTGISHEVQQITEQPATSHLDYSENTLDAVWPLGSADAWRILAAVPRSDWKRPADVPILPGWPQ